MIDADMSSLRLRALLAEIRVVGPAHVLDGLRQHVRHLVAKDPVVESPSLVIDLEVGVDRRDGVDYYRLVGEDTHVGGVGQEWILQELIAAVNAAAARSAAPTHGVLHGACVQFADHAVLLAGPSGAGKTTQAAACVLAGARYVSDEITAWSPQTLSVVPFHRPLGVRRAAAEALGLNAPDATDELVPWLPPDDVLSSGAALSALVLISNRPGSTISTPLEPGEALALLAGLTLGALGHEAVMFRRIEHVVRRVPAFSVDRADAVDAVTVIRHLVGS